MLKPSGVRAGVGDEAAARLGELGLRLRCRHAVIADEEVAYGLSREPERYMVEPAVTWVHLVGKPVEFLVVEGPEAIARTLAVRNEIRSARARGPFTNLVHAPDSPAELRAQCHVITGCSGWSHHQPGLGLVAGAAAGDPPRPRLMRGTPATSGLLPASPSWEVVTEIVQALWDDPGSVIWCGVTGTRPAAIDQGDDHHVVVHNQRRQPLDRTVGALVRAVEVELPVAIALALQCVHRSTYVVAVGSARGTSWIRGALRREGLDASVVASPPPTPSKGPCRPQT